MALFYPIDDSVYEQNKDNKEKKLYFIDKESEVHFIRGLGRLFWIGKNPRK